MWLDLFALWCTPWFKIMYLDFWQAGSAMYLPGAQGIGDIPANYVGC